MTPGNSEGAMMKVKYWMTRDPVTVGPETLLADAARIMKERGFRRLPVMENGKLAGLVTYRNILEAQPSSVSTLSVYEARYLVTKLKVRDVMRKDVITIAPDDDVLSAMLEGNKKGIGSYPVVDGGRLIGIVTATDLFNLIVHILGADARDEFINISEPPERFKSPGYLAKLVEILAPHDIAVLSFLSFPHRGDNNKAVATLRISPGKRNTAVGILASSGYVIVS